MSLLNLYFFVKERFTKAKFDQTDETKWEISSSTEYVLN